MRCPKCHYISFESVDRCRNCGYDFSLAEPQPAPVTELPLNDRNEDPFPPMDLSLSKTGSIPSYGSGAGTPADLPLFKNGSGAREPMPAALGRRVDPLGDDDAPLVRPSAAPRPPIAVRRALADAQRPRSRYSLAEVPLLLPEPLDPALDHDGHVDSEAEVDQGPAAPGAAAPAPAPAGRRALAGVIDLAIVAGIDAAVLYFTLKLCALPLTVQGLLGVPLVPLAVFLLMIDAGYVITFTAVVGQTIGKMATGLKVVRMREDDSEAEQPDFSFAIVRTAAYAASLLPAGLGFLPALLGKDRRALHDRLAETRVVRWGHVVKS